MPNFKDNFGQNLLRILTNFLYQPTANDLNYSLKASNFILKQSAFFLDLKMAVFIIRAKFSKTSEIARKDEFTKVVTLIT